MLVEGCEKSCSIWIADKNPFHHRGHRGTQDISRGEHLHVIRVTSSYEPFFDNGFAGELSILAGRLEDRFRAKRSRAMFEQEIEMEKRDSSVVPLLLIIALILAIVGVAGYYIIQNRQVLSMQDAAKVAASSLQSQAPPSLTFHTGMVKSSVADNPQGVHYKLLQKAGLIVMGKAQGTYGTTLDRKSV